MPKRHRQPEPIDIESAAHRSSRHANSSVPPKKKNNLTHSTTASSASSSSPLRASHGLEKASAGKEVVYSPGEQKLVEETRKKAHDFPATPDSLARLRKQQEADAKRRRVSFDRDGQPQTEADALSHDLSSKGTAPLAADLVPSTTTASPGRRSLGESDGFDRLSGEEEGETAASDDDGSDLSSNDYVGDDGNQPSSDSAPDSDADDDDEAAELRGLRRAVAAAAAARQRAGNGATAADGASSSSSSSEGEEDSDDDSQWDEEDLQALMNGGDSDEEDDTDEEGDEEGEGDSFDEEDEEEEGRRATHNGSDDDDDEDSEGGLITVDFGVFDMEKSNIDGLIHLMDQLCPDKMNEVDRDDLGLALLESPFTSVVRLQNNGEDATGEEEQEFYGLSSVLDVAHGQQLYPLALKPLCELLQQHVWRQAASGIPPTDILTSVVDDERAVATSRAKCLLLVAEYIRNIPLELTVQILEDVLDRLDNAGREESKDRASVGATHDNPIFATQPSMFAVLAKVQRATDAPVTLLKSGRQPAQQQDGSSAAATEEANTASSARGTSSGAKKHPHGKKTEKAGGAAMSAPEAPLDLTHYIFWREEDSILYEFRDKRVAALVYRCRAQYDGQPEHEIPLSILFVLQYGAVRQAVDEMKRRQTVNAAIERY